MNKHFFLPLVLPSVTALAASLLFAAPTQPGSPIPATTPFTISDEELAKLSDEDIARTDRHRQELLTTAADNVEKVAGVAANQRNSIADIQAANLQATKAFGEYRDAAETQIAAGNKAITALNHVLQKLHLAKWIMCGLVLAVAAFVAIEVPMVGIYGAAAIAAGGCAAVWFFL